MPEEREASRTAEGVALIRAAHQILDKPPRILDDPVSPLLVGPERLEAIRRNPDRVNSPAAAGLRSHVLVRSRYAEDRLHGAVDRGVTQYVALGAGLDTFAYRQPAWASSLRIFEVDHPASQAAKRARLAGAGIAVPSNVSFVALDLESDPVGPGLAAAGFDPARPAFISCLGVLAYLAPPTVDAVFAWVVSLPAGTQFVFTFAQPESGPERGTAARAAELDEPWQTRLAREQIRRRLSELGYASVAFVEPAEIAAYFGGRSDALRPPSRVSIVRAVV
jgi:methyltransferase (TIGR00027 family)